MAALIWPGLHLGLKTLEWHNRNFAGYMAVQRTIVDCLEPETLPPPCVDAFAATPAWASENMLRVARLSLRDGPPNSPWVTPISAALYPISILVIFLSTLAIALDTRRQAHVTQPPEPDDTP
ncbi:hypothetical protein A8B78_09020 [Jannaschia sp. EhC01]|nr:hypothetical protein A8B78_09020 [Jannaschia sp. EhC01]